MKMEVLRLVLLGHMTNSELKSELSDALTEFAVTGRTFWKTTKLRPNKQRSQSSLTSTKWQLEPRTKNHGEAQ
jgi:hypothetical protein